MEKIKIFVINNRCGNLSAIYSACKKWGWELDIEEIEVSESLKFADYGEGVGLDMYLTNSRNSNAIGCQAIVYIYKPEPNPFIKPLKNWTYCLDGRPQCQIVKGDWSDGATAENMAHELCHAMWCNLRNKGFLVEDKTDNYETGPKAILGELKRLEDYSSVLIKPLPIDAEINKKLFFIRILQGFKKLFMSILNQKNLRDLAMAMSIQEGFPIVGSRAARNHNPLNLKYVGQVLAKGRDDKGFCMFENDDDGWKACLNDLRFKRDGKSITGLSGNSTVADLICVWTKGDPESIQQSYINSVCIRLNISPTFQLKNFVG